MDGPYLRAESVSLNFPIFSRDSRSLKRVIGRLDRRSRINMTEGKIAVVEGIKNINISVEAGDRLALIGPNGAGKTTLLQVLAGIYFPSDGRVERSGTLTTLLGVGMGLDMDASGMENIFIAHYLYGLRNYQIKVLVEDIVDFCELDEFIHMPVRTYSAGMRTRLAFAISTSFVPDILLIDEVFGAGDKTFVKKSQSRMETLMKKSRILVFASHNDKLLQTFCNKAILLKDGSEVIAGGVSEVLSAYEEMTI